MTPQQQIHALELECIRLRQEVQRLRAANSRLSFAIAQGGVVRLESGPAPAHVIAALVDAVCPRKGWAAA